MLAHRCMMINRKKEQKYSNMLTAKEYSTEGVAVGRMMQGRSISWGEAYEAGLKAKVKYDPKVCFFLFKKRGGGAWGKKKLEGNKTNCRRWVSSREVFIFCLSL